MYNKAFTVISSSRDITFGLAGFFLGAMVLSMHWPSQAYCTCWCLLPASSLWLEMQHGTTMTTKLFEMLKTGYVGPRLDDLLYGTCKVHDNVFSVNCIDDCHST